PPRRGLDKNFHPAGIENAEQAEAEQTAKPFDPGIGFTAATGEPSVVARCRTIHGLLRRRSG
ncbi:MAG: hypothetical protein ACLPV8_11995, partial [Steroidobacteraceae bacterium]